MGAYERMKSDEQRIKDAALRILDVSEELHLTWAEFENVLVEVKKKAAIGRQR